MYQRQRTWLEQGPRRTARSACAPAVRGMGDFTSWCSGLSKWNPLSIACVGEYASGRVADYDRQQWPAPPAAAPPGAPQTYEEMTVAGAWTPEQSAQASMDQTTAQNSLFFSDLAAAHAADPSSAAASAWSILAGIVGVVAAVAVFAGSSRGRR